MKTFSGRRASQNEWELTQFIDLLVKRGVRRYLEIGARHGDTFHAVMSVLPAESRGIAVDLPGGAWGVGSSEQVLRGVTLHLRKQGYAARHLFGDSQDALLQARVQEAGPFDAVLIDGDHRYEGVKADWESYGDMAPLVAFHDTAGHGEIQPTSKLPVEVPRLWAELKPQFETVEFIAPGSTMGIGCLLR